MLHREIIVVFLIFTHSVKDVYINSYFFKLLYKMMKIKTMFFSIIFISIAMLANGQITLRKHPSAESLKKLARIVETSPDSLKFHEAFIDVFDINDPRLANQYKYWMKRFSKSAVVPFALGKTYEEYADTTGIRYLLRALKINPTMAGAWKYLSQYATRVGDTVTALDLMHKASLGEPLNPDYAYRYASLNKNKEAEKYDSLMMNVAFHFPNSEYGALALYDLASFSYNEHEKIAYYEAFYQLYVKQQFPAFRAGMRDYYAYLLNNNFPDQAFNLALRLGLQMKINRGLWKHKLSVARAFVEARKLIDENKADEAFIMLNKVNLGNSKVNGTEIDADETLSLFKAEAMCAANRVKDAYDSIAMVYSKKPSNRLRKALINYAVKANIDSTKIDTEIWRIRNKSALKEADFKLKNQTDNSEVSLSDYKGKIVLLTYWSPGCQPCLREFPHFEAVLKKLGNKNVIYLGVDLYNMQKNFVLPIVQANHYTFVPLIDEPNEPTLNIPKVTEIPTNFLIDQKGRIIFSNFRIDDKNEQTLELMITELLKMGNG
jgi:thiol-disulfide isomerase/thioredoxin